jgi:ethanolamine utilization protein EutQ (cupin superfamily)
MAIPGVPVLVDSADVENYVVGANGDEGVIKRLIGREQESAVLLGTFRLEPGQLGKFELPHANGMEEEIYYLLSGRLRVRWPAGELVAESGHAIFFPSGGSYDIETVGSAPVDLIWTGCPAP